MQVDGANDEGEGDEEEGEETAPIDGGGDHQETEPTPNEEQLDESMDTSTGDLDDSPLEPEAALAAVKQADAVST